MTKRNALMGTIASALAGTADVGTRIYRSRVEAFARAELPALVVEPVSDTAVREAVGRFNWTLSFQVSVLVRGDVPDDAADAIVADVHSKIMSSAALDGMLVDLLPDSVKFQFVEADTPMGIVSMRFSAVYQTSTTDLSA